MFFFCFDRSVQESTKKWRVCIPEMQVKGECVSLCVFMGKVSPFLWQLDEPHITEAEVNQVLQQLLPDLVLNGLMG